MAILVLQPFRWSVHLSKSDKRFFSKPGMVDAQMLEVICEEK